MELGRRSLLATVLSSLLIVALAGTATAQPARDALLSDLPVVGELQGGGTFEGTLDVTNVALNQAGDLVLTGVLDGVLSTGQVVEDLLITVTATLTNTGGAVCDILLLELGPIDLDLLGLVVNISPIEINIDAVSGPGNLLGNLLCAVVGLLDQGGPLSGLLGLLRNINRILG